jgi:hypothetical protein
MPNLPRSHLTQLKVLGGGRPPWIGDRSRERARDSAQGSFGRRRITAQTQRLAADESKRALAEAQEIIERLDVLRP